MNPPDQRGRTQGGQYYAEYATINSQGGRSGPNRPPDIPQVNPAMQDYTDYQGKIYLSLQHASCGVQVMIVFFTSCSQSYYVTPNKLHTTETESIKTYQSQQTVEPFQVNISRKLCFDD